MNKLKQLLASDRMILVYYGIAILVFGLYFLSRILFYIDFQHSKDTLWFFQDSSYAWLRHNVLRYLGFVLFGLALAIFFVGNSNKDPFARAHYRYLRTSFWLVVGLWIFEFVFLRVENYIGLGPLGFIGMIVALLSPQLMFLGGAIFVYGLIRSVHGFNCFRKGLYPEPKEAKASATVKKAFVVALSMLMLMPFTHYKSTWLYRSATWYVQALFHEPAGKDPYVLVVKNTEKWRPLGVRPIYQITDSRCQDIWAASDEVFKDDLDVIKPTSIIDGTQTFIIDPDLMPSGHCNWQLTRLSLVELDTPPWTNHIDILTLSLPARSRAEGFVAVNSHLFEYDISKYCYPTDMHSADEKCVTYRTSTKYQFR